MPWVLRLYHMSGATGMLPSNLLNGVKELRDEYAASARNYSSRIWPDSADRMTILGCMSSIIAGYSGGEVKDWTVVRRFIWMINPWSSTTHIFWTTLPTPFGSIYLNIRIFDKPEYSSSRKQELDFNHHCITICSIHSETTSASIPTQNISSNHQIF